MFFLKLLHESNQLFNTFDRHCVIDTCTHTANGTVALQVHKAGLSCCLNKLCVQRIVAGDKGYIHQGAILLTDSTTEQFAAVQEVVNNVPRHREWSEGYGYHLWPCTNGRFRGDGSEGQFCIISPKQNMLVAATACTENLTGEHDLFDEYLFNDERQTPATREEQQAYLERLKTLAVAKK